MAPAAKALVSSHRRAPSRRSIALHLFVSPAAAQPPRAPPLHGPTPPRCRCLLAPLSSDTSFLRSFFPRLMAWTYVAASPCLVSSCRCCWPRSTACICAAASFLSVFSLATTLRVCVRSVPLDSPLGMRGDRAGWASGVRVLHCSPGSEGGLRIQGCGNCCVDCCCGCVGVDLSPPLAFELAVPQTPSFSQCAVGAAPCGWSLWPAHVPAHTRVLAPNSPPRWSMHNDQWCVAA